MSFKRKFMRHADTSHARGSARRPNPPHQHVRTSRPDEESDGCKFKHAFDYCARCGIAMKKLAKPGN